MPDSMTIEAKKLNIVRWVLSLSDESVVDSLESMIDGFSDDTAVDLQRYATEIEPTTDLAKIKKEQGFTQPDKARVHALIDELDIPEPLEALLNDLD